MQILYVDSSGDDGWPIPHGKSSCRHHVTVGLSIDSGKWSGVANQTQAAFTKYFPDPANRPKEFHYTELVGGKGTYRQLSGSERKSLADDVLRIIINAAPTLFAVVVKKDEHYIKYLTARGSNAERPGMIGVTFLIPRFNMFLLRNHEVGCMVLDCENLKKDRRLQYEIQRMRVEGAIRSGPFSIQPFFYQTHFENVIESCFFVPSELSPGIQLADFCAYSIWTKFEHGRQFRYNQLYRFFDRTPQGTRVGLKMWP